jgi:hypothetical protein
LDAANRGLVRGNPFERTPGRVIRAPLGARPTAPWNGPRFGAPDWPYLPAPPAGLCARHGRRSRDRLEHADSPGDSPCRWRATNRGSSQSPAALCIRRSRLFSL